MSNTINVNYMTRAYNQYQQKNAAKDQEKEDTVFRPEPMCILLFLQSVYLNCKCTACIPPSSYL